MSEVKNEGLEVVAYAVSVTRRPWPYRLVVREDVAIEHAENVAPEKAEVQPLCLHSEALAGYAARDARISELEKELSACATAVDNCELFRVLIAELESAIEVGKRLNSRQAEGDQDE